MTNFGTRLLTVLIVVMAFAVAVSCSNDNDDPGAPGLQTGVIATFTALANPAADTITLQVAAGSGPAAGDEFLVDIEVGGITDFWGATFDVSYSTGQFTLLAIDASNSFLDDPAIDNDFLTQNLDGAGDMVTITKQAINGDEGGVSAAGTLATLHFRALRTMTAEPITLRNVVIQTCGVGQNCVQDEAGNLGIAVSGGTVTAVPNS